VLPQSEIDHLDRLVDEAGAASVEIASDGGMVCVVLSGFRLPLGYSAERVDLLLRLPPGFPDAPPDMFWVTPVITRSDGSPIQAAESLESYLGRTWQRFSRHLPPGQWRPGIDSVDSYLALVRKELARTAGG
jgi:hypothetical protein